MSAIRISTPIMLLFFGLPPLLYAQRPVSPQEPAAIGLPIALSNTIIDSQGNLLRFQIQYTKNTLLTLVSGVTPNKVIVSPRDYPGSMSQIVAGERAIYAVTASPITATTGSSAALNLVALYLDDGALPAIPPTLPLDGYAEMKIASTPTSDVIYLVQTAIYPYRTPSATVQGLVRMIAFDGKKFNDLGKVQLP